MLAAFDPRKRYLAGLGASPRIAYDDVAINRLLLTCQQKFLAAQEALADEADYLARLIAQRKTNPASVPAATIAWYQNNLAAHKRLFVQAAAHCRQHIRPRRKPPVFPPIWHQRGWGISGWGATRKAWGMGDDGGFTFGPPSAPPPIYGPDAPPPDIIGAPSVPSTWPPIFGTPSQPALPPSFFTFNPPQPSPGQIPTSPSFNARWNAAIPVPNLPNVAPPTQAAMIISSGPPRPAGSLIPGVPNSYLLYGGGALVLIMALGKKGRR
jgi:hypothetical protein